MKLPRDSNQAILYDIASLLDRVLGAESLPHQIGLTEAETAWTRPRPLADAKRSRPRTEPAAELSEEQRALLLDYQKSVNQSLQQLSNEFEFIQLISAATFLSVFPGPNDSLQIPGRYEPEIELWLELGGLEGDTTRRPEWKDVASGLETARESLTCREAIDLFAGAADAWSECCRRVRVKYRHEVGRSYIPVANEMLENLETDIGAKVARSIGFGVTSLLEFSGSVTETLSTRVDTLRLRHSKPTRSASEYDELERLMSKVTIDEASQVVFIDPGDTDWHFGQQCPREWDAVKEAVGMPATDLLGRRSRSVEGRTSVLKPIVLFGHAFFVPMISRITMDALATFDECVARAGAGDAFFRARANAVDRAAAKGLRSIAPRAEVYENLKF